MTINKVLVAYDFSDPSNRALSFAGRLARDTSAKLELVYVHPDIYDGRGDPSLTLPAAMPGQGERYLQFLEQELKTAASKLLGAEDVACHVLRGDPVKRIEAAAQSSGADVICVAATGKGAVDRVLLGSVSQRLLRTSPVPVLIVP